MFPGAVAETEFVRATASALEPIGFDRKSTLPCVATCRDELCQSLVEAVGARWSVPFVLSGLAGLILAGKSGFAAALSHAPDAGGRERYLFVAAPHVAIGAGGEPGLCRRPGRSGTTAACGALAAVLGELEAGSLGSFDDPDDVELSRLRQRVGKPAGESGVADLFALTSTAHDVIRAELESSLAEVVDTARIDYAVATGVQIHGPAGETLFWPGGGYAVVDGARREIAIEP